MTTPLAHSSSDNARLMVNAPGFAPGWQQTVPVAAPAAGAGWSYVSSGGYFERLVTVQFKLVTSATVANRTVVLQLVDNNGVEVTRVPCVAAVPASQTVTSHLMAGAPAFAGNSAFDVYGFLPDILVPPDWKWRTFQFNLDAADQFSNIVILTQQFPNDNTIMTDGS